ncbi:hypothetical protein SUGI_0863180 [Cryptomeria japonica]|nr:hypothetical protein SUGI_0863180 [Cryptomeria japonica]
MAHNSPGHGHSIIAGLDTQAAPSGKSLKDAMVDKTPLPENVVFVAQAETPNDSDGRARGYHCPKAD